jgi:hypothetical protein
MLELIARFLVIGTLAFGGGQAALPLVERLAVADTGWLTPVQFATGVGLSYATPGPVLILAAFIGYHVAAVPGALAATAAVFAVPDLRRFRRTANQQAQRCAVVPGIRTFRHRGGGWAAWSHIDRTCSPGSRYPPNFAGGRSSGIRRRIEWDSSPYPDRRGDADRCDFVRPRLIAGVGPTPPGRQT